MSTLRRTPRRTPRVAWITWINLSACATVFVAGIALMVLGHADLGTLADSVTLAMVCGARRGPAGPPGPPDPGAPGAPG